MATIQAGARDGRGPATTRTPRTAWLEQATESARRSGNPAAIAGILQMRGRVAARAGRDADAQRWFREARLQFDAIGDQRFRLSAQSEIAHSLRRTGAIDEADAEYRQTIVGWQRTGNRGAVANQLESLAFTRIGQGRRPGARRGCSAPPRSCARPPATR